MCKPFHCSTTGAVRTPPQTCRRARSPCSALGTTLAGALRRYPTKRKGQGAEQRAGSPPEPGKERGEHVAQIILNSEETLARNSVQCETDCPRASQTQVISIIL